MGRYIISALGGRQVPPPYCLHTFSVVPSSLGNGSCDGDSQDRNPVLTVLYVPSLVDSGTGIEHNRRADRQSRPAWRPFPCCSSPRRCRTGRATYNTLTFYETTCTACTIDGLYMCPRRTFYPRSRAGRNIIGALIGSQALIRQLRRKAVSSPIACGTVHNRRAGRQSGPVTVLS